MTAPALCTHSCQSRLRSTLLAIALSLAVSGVALAEGSRNESKVLGSITAEAGQTYGSLDSVNGGIAIRSGATVRSAETVNGGISIADGASVGNAETVNGGIRIGGKVKLGSAETVNGGISVEEDSEVSGGLETVNGAIRIGARSVVAGNAETVNGGLRLDGGTVKGRLLTVNGDVVLGRGAKAGGIEVEEPNRGWFNWGAEKMPRIVIGPEATVSGPMIFKREVSLFVHTSATIGEVTGATPVRYEGETPPE